MEDQLVSEETAKLAMSKNFDIITPNFWQYRHYKDGYEAFDNSDHLIKCYPEKGDLYRPTQSLLAKWLRDSHKIEVFVLPIFREKCGYDSFKRDGFSFEVIKVSPCVYLDYFAFNKCGEDRDNSEDNPFFNKTFHSYEFCLEHALQEALKLI